MPFLVFWEDKIFLSKMFAKLIVSFILIYLYVCVVLRTSIQSYFTFHVQFLKFLWLSMC